MEMTIEAQEAKNAYMRQYRDKNRDRINAKQREWSARNPDKVKAYRERYWRRKAGNLRLPWSAYGISKERKRELMEIAKLDEYADMVLAAALKADRQAAGHIILSATRGIPFDYLEYHDRLGRCTLGRTDFYGARRLFFHYLDMALKEKLGDSGEPAVQIEGENVPQCEPQNELQSVPQSEPINKQQ